MLENISSIATLTLFVIYFVGRIITIVSTRRIWKDRVEFVYGTMDTLDNYTRQNCVDQIYVDEFQKTLLYGVLTSVEGIRNISVYTAELDSNDVSVHKGRRIYHRDLLNPNQSLVFHVETGELRPTLFIEYTSFDYMKIEFGWQDNLKSGVFSECVEPKHTIKSFLYYLCR